MRARDHNRFGFGKRRRLRRRFDFLLLIFSQQRRRLRCQPQSIRLEARRLSRLPLLLITRFSRQLFCRRCGLPGCALTFLLLALNAVKFRLFLALDAFQFPPLQFLLLAHAPFFSQSEILPQIGNAPNFLINLH